MDFSWDELVEKAFKVVVSQGRIGSLRPVSLSPEIAATFADPSNFETLEGLRPSDRAAVEVSIDEPTFCDWLNEITNAEDPNGGAARELEYETRLAGSNVNKKMRKLILYSTNDYLGLTSHPSVRKVAGKATLKLGMGPRSSSLMCGYTDYHRLLESTLAEMKNKEECLLLPTGFSANLTLMAGIGSIATLLSENGRPRTDERIAIFSDSLNHASIIDGLRFVERNREAEVYVYRHCDTIHLEKLLSNCPLKRKVVVTDGLFSMDGDFCPLDELVLLRKKHGFLLIVDDAHGSFICGENGNGVAEMFNCENEVDIFVGTLSKAAGSLGGFISCSKAWKQLIQSRGRAFIFSTALPVPVVAAAYAAITLAKKEKWRRQALWNLVHAFSSLTKIKVDSPIISLILGDEKTCKKASRELLRLGLHVIPVTPPAVPPNSCRLRISLSTAHTLDDIKFLVASLSRCIDLSNISTGAGNFIEPTYAKL